MKDCIDNHTSCSTVVLIVVAYEYGLTEKGLVSLLDLFRRETIEVLIDPA
jgi:hypothetical protein